MFETMNIGLHFTKPTKALKKQEISQINKSYEFFIMDQSSSYIIRTYSYIETNMHLIYKKNAFKRCIKICTFHDNLLFYIIIMFWRWAQSDFGIFCLYVYFHIHKHNERYNQ